MFYAIGRLLLHVTNATALIAGVMVCLMMVQVSIDVVARYIFSAPLPATIVFVSHYYMLFVVFLPLAVPARIDRHISVEIVTERFPAVVQRPQVVAASGRLRHLSRHDLGLVAGGDGEILDLRAPDREQSDGSDMARVLHPSHRLLSDRHGSSLQVPGLPHRPAQRP
jgi:hypothetical protein